MRTAPVSENAIIKIEYHAVGDTAVLWQLCMVDVDDVQN